MVKDRLNDLKKLQKKNSSTVDIEDTEAGSSNDASGNSLKKTFDRAEVLAQWIQTIEDNVDKIREFLRNSNDINFGSTDIQDQLTSLFENNTSISHKVTTKLKEIDAELKNINPDSAEGRIKTIQFNSLKIRYTEAFQQNSVELNNCKNIQKRILEAQIRAKGVNVTDEQLESLLQDGTDQVFTENIIMETANAKQMLADIEERHRQLLKIEQMLVEVKDLFLHMAILVDNQQELLNRIEYQANLASELVGAVDLKIVAKSKAKHTRRKIYIALFVIILIAVILIIVFK